jgi:hypothetical protein
VTRGPIAWMGAQTKEAANRGGLECHVRPLLQWDHFKAVETLLKVVFRLVPSVCTATMIATETPAAIRPYSMAVAPD